MQTSTIVYWGPALAGKTTNINALWEEWPDEERRSYLVRDVADSPILECELQVDDTWYRVTTFPGEAFSTGSRRELAMRGDVFVFVADCRAERRERNKLYWDSLHDYFAEREERRPIVMQYNRLDDPTSIGADAVKEDLGIHPFLELAGSPVANPYALVVSAHHEAIATDGEGVRETFDAALRALDEGVPKLDDVASIGLSQVDAIIKAKLTDAFSDIPGIEGLVGDMLANVGEEGAADDLHKAVADHAQVQIAQMLEDPETRDELLASVFGSLVGSWDYIVAPMPCSSCGHKHEAFPTFLGGGDGTRFEVGQPVFSGDALREDYYIRVREPEATLSVLEVLECESCGAVSWCRLSFEDGVLRSVWPAELNRATLFGSHVAASDVVLVAAGMTGADPHELPVDEALSILRERL